jgi:hypothetical protein
MDVVDKETLAAIGIVRPEVTSLAAQGKDPDKDPVVLAVRWMRKQRSQVRDATFELNCHYETGYDIGTPEGLHLLLGHLDRPDADEVERAVELFNKGIPSAETAD